MDVYLQAGSSSSEGKFWAIKVDGCDVSVSYGKVGKKGITIPKTFDTAEKATKFAKKELKKKGKQRVRNCRAR